MVPEFRAQRVLACRSSAATVNVPRFAGAVTAVPLEAATEESPVAVFSVPSAVAPAPAAPVRKAAKWLSDPEKLSWNDVASGRARWHGAVNWMRSSPAALRRPCSPAWLEMMPLAGLNFGAWRSRASAATQRPSGAVGTRPHQLPRSDHAAVTMPHAACPDGWGLVRHVMLPPWRDGA